MTRKRRPQTVVIRTYSPIDELLASPTEPLSAEKRRHQLTRMWQGLHQIETAPAPSTDDWRVCSDAVNLMETLTREGERLADDSGNVTPGWWRDCSGAWVQIRDDSKLLMDAVYSLAAAGTRRLTGGQIRLDAAGILAVRSVLEDYRDLLEVLPARTIIRAHRLTEERIAEIFAGKRKPHDVEIVDLRVTT